MILHRECKAGVHLQRPLSSGLGETGRGVPGLGDLQAHLAAAWGSGLNWMDCVPGEADYASGAWRVCFRPLPGFLSFFFFFFLSRNRQRCTPGRCFATSGNSLPKSSVGPGAPVWDRGDHGPLLFCFSSARAALMATGGQLCPPTPVPVE